MFPIENGDILASYVSLPEGKFHQIPHDSPNSCQRLQGSPPLRFGPGLPARFLKNLVIRLFSKWKPSGKKSPQFMVGESEIVKAQL